MPPGDPLADEIVRLYGLPPEEFVAARNATVTAWRRDKRTDDAARIAALRKPSVIESAVNRSAHRDPETAAAWAAATRAADEAQSASVGGADAAGLRAAVKALRTATEAMVHATVTTIGDPTRRDDVAALLRAVPVGAVDQVAAGVLGSAARPEDELFAGAPSPPPPRERPAPKVRRASARTPRPKEPEPAAPPPPPPAPPQPSRRERALAAAVQTRRAALTQAAADRDTARAEADAARRRLDSTERAHAAAEAALADAEHELRVEQESHRT